MLIRRNKRYTENSLGEQLAKRPLRVCDWKKKSIFSIKELVPKTFCHQVFLTLRRCFEQENCYEEWKQ